MSDYQICKNCVMDSSDPGIIFDQNGVCDHCNGYYKNILPFWKLGKGKEKELERIVAKIKKEGEGKDFDCLMGMSGGADSSYMLHVAVKELGLRPLVFHVDGGWNSKVSTNNINVMIEKLGLDLYTEVINWEEMKDFQLAYFKSGLPNIDVPQDHAFVATLYYFAEKHKIKYILNGGNFSTECVRNPKRYFYYGTDMRQIGDVIKKFGTRPLRTYPFSSVLRHKFYLRYIKGVEVVKLLNYFPYIKADAMEMLNKEYGWHIYKQKHFESRFTRFYEGYWLPQRFGFDSRRVQYSSLILTEQMKRDDALRALEEPALSDGEVREEFTFVAKKLNISEEKLRTYLEMALKFHDDYNNSEKLFDFGATILHHLGIERAKKR